MTDWSSSVANADGPGEAQPARPTLTAGAGVGTEERVPSRSAHIAAGEESACPGAETAEASEVHGANLRAVLAGFSDHDLTVFDDLPDRLRAAPPFT